MANDLQNTYGNSREPCREAAKASLKCLDRNNYDKLKCQLTFDAYKLCKRDWNAARAEKRRQGLPPLTVEEFRQKAFFLSLCACDKIDDIEYMTSYDS